jgi:hypothetical protein
MTKKKIKADEPVVKSNPAEKVELWDLARLVPHAQNSRVHSPSQVDQIVSSIKQWGFTTAILVDDGGIIIAGHGRVLAAQKMGLTKVPVMVAHGWTEEQKRAYLIADNKIALNASWDLDLLRTEVADLGDLGFEVGLLGFNVSEMSALFTPVEVGTIDPMAEWSGMPEFESENQKPYRTILVHFENDADVDDFAKLVGQQILPKTKYLWVPRQEIKVSDDKRWDNA